MRIARSACRDVARLRSRAIGRAPFVVALCAAAVCLSVLGVPAPTADAAATTAGFSGTWFAPYVDTTLPPMYAVADPASDPAGQSAFGFIVSKTATDCTPSWGTYYSLSQADSAPLFVSRAFSAMEAEGKTPIISFGGEANTTLADACSTEGALLSAYRGVIEHYGLEAKPAVVDLDIEGAAQGDIAAINRQAAALAQLQATAAAAGGTLGVWLTLPVATTGLLPVAQNVVRAMLAAGVRLSGVNVMTMYFWPSPGNGAPMLAAVESALEATHGQLSRLFASEGVAADSAQVWEHEGATVQIGDAGIPDQAFTVSDAKGLVAFAGQVGLGRISMWSINQDQPCADGATGGYSTYCSGVTQAPLAFDDTFAALEGSALSTPLLPAATGAPVTTALPSGSTPTRTSTPQSTSDPQSTSTAQATSDPQSTSDPTPSPSSVTGTFPAWSASMPYPGGYKVLLGTTVFQAKWWNEGVVPVANPTTRWSTPWKVVGSVPSGTQPWTPPTLAPGTYPTWSPSVVYTAGKDVLFEGLGYQAKWWNDGTAPDPLTAAAGNSPWKPLWVVPGEPS